MGYNCGLPFGTLQTLIAPLHKNSLKTYTFWDDIHLTMTRILFG
jgi:hypothetical protein